MSRLLLFVPDLLIIFVRSSQLPHERRTASISLSRKSEPFFVHPAVRKIGHKIPARFLNGGAQLWRRPGFPPLIHEFKNNAADRVAISSSRTVGKDIFPIS